MEQTRTTPALPGPPRRSGVGQRPADAVGTGALHPLESRRIAAGFDTVAELAAAAGLSRRGVSLIEEGKTANVRTGTVRKLATVLRVPVEVLLSELRNPTGGVNHAHEQALVVAVRHSAKQRVRYVSDSHTPGDPLEEGTVLAGPEFGVGTCLYEVAWDEGDATWTPANHLEAIA